MGVKIEGGGKTGRIIGSTKSSSSASSGSSSSGGGLSAQNQATLDAIKKGGSNQQIEGTENLAVSGTKVVPRSVIQTTTAQRATTQSNVQKFNDLQARFVPAPQVTTPPGTPQGGQPTSDKNQQKSQTVDVAKDIQNIDGTRTVTYSDGTTARVKATKNPDGTESYEEVPQGAQNAIETQIGAIRTRGAQQIEWAKNSLATLRKTSSAATAAMLDEIESAYGERITAMEQTNKTAVQASTQAGLRTGGATGGAARYTPQTYQGVLTDEEVQGHKRITQLKSAMLTAMQKATREQAANDTKAFNDTFEMIQKIQTATDNEVTNLYNLSLKEQAFKLDQETAQRKQEQDAIKNAGDLSERAAPAIAAELDSFTTQAEKDAFLDKFAEQNGIDPAILRGDVENALTEIKKQKMNEGKDARDAKMDDLQMQNIRSEINRRSALTAKENKETQSPGSIISNGKTITGDELQQFQDILISGGEINGKHYNARGDDGYVDPWLYLTMSKHWTKQGYATTDFTKKYPPANFINPKDNPNLPTYLRNTTDKSETTRSWAL